MKKKKKEIIPLKRVVWFVSLVGIRSHGPVTHLDTKPHRLDFNEATCEL